MFLQIDFVPEISPTISACEFCRLFRALLVVFEKGQLNSEGLVAVFANKFLRTFTLEDRYDVLIAAALYEAFIPKKNIIERLVEQ